MRTGIITAIVGVGVTVGGCSSGPASESSDADAQVVYFGTAESTIMKRALRNYRAAFDDAVSRSTISTCNDALDLDNTSCFADRAENLDQSVDRLFDKTPARGGYHPDCRVGLKNWMAFLGGYRRYTENLAGRFEDGEFNQVIRGLELYPRMVEFEARMQDKALPKLITTCYLDGGGQNLLARPGRLG